MCVYSYICAIKEGAAVERTEGPSLAGAAAHVNYLPFFFYFFLFSNQAAVRLKILGISSYKRPPELWIYLKVDTRMGERF